MTIYELIHTHCNEGMDIQQNKLISSQGIKEYYYSQELVDGLVDIPYIYPIARKKHSFEEPSYMPEDYTYHVPDPGSGFLGFMHNFYPMPYDPCDTDYEFESRRGNYLNQMIFGNFIDANIYPYELFGNKTIWNAKEMLGPTYKCGDGKICIHEHGQGRTCQNPDGIRLKNYRFYYNTPPVATALRQILPTTTEDNKSPDYIYLDNPKYSVHEIKEFIKAGRQKLLSKAVAFLIDQFQAKEPSMFLVIHDSNITNIEKWIGAIQLAFSPRIASSISFATRMDGYDKSYRYYVDDKGRYQKSNSLKATGLHARFHAMIVGLDARDKNGVPNSSSNSPFVVLDGIAMTLPYEADTSHQYFGFITDFDERHIEFSRNIVQTFSGLTKPSRDICYLLDAIGTIENLDTINIPPAGLLEWLYWLSDLIPGSTDAFRNIWEKIARSLFDYFKTDSTGGALITDWLYSHASLTGVKDSKDYVTKQIYEAFERSLFKNGDIAKAKEQWQATENMDDTIRAKLANKIISYKGWNNFVSKKFNSSTFNDCFILMNFYIECVKHAESECVKNLAEITECTFIAANEQVIPHQDIVALIRILETVVEDNVSFILNILAKSKGKNETLVRYMIECLIFAYEYVDDDDKMHDFIDQLTKHSLDGFIGIVLDARYKKLKEVKKREYHALFVKSIVRYSEVSEVKLIYKDIDTLHNKRLTEQKAHGIANALVEVANTLDCMCPNAAHICALFAATPERQLSNIVKYYQSLTSHGFPSVADEAYRIKLSNALSHVQYDNSGCCKDAHHRLLDMFAQADYFYEYTKALSKRALKGEILRFFSLLEFSLRKENEEIEAAIINALASNFNSKAFVNIGNKIEDPDLHKYLDKLAECVYAQQNPKKVARDEAKQTKQTKQTQARASELLTDIDGAKKTLKERICSFIARFFRRSK